GCLGRASSEWALSESCESHVKLSGWVGMINCRRHVMSIFEWTSEVPLGAETSYHWHAQPGALTRLSPHWAQEIVEESYPPIAPGSVAQVRTSVPGTYGLLR